MTSFMSNLKIQLFILLLLTMIGCHKGGVISGISLSTEAKKITQPSISTPLSSPYYYSGNQVTVSGLCTDGYIVKLVGITIEQQSCQDSQYEFSLNQTTDGVFQYSLSQTNQQTQESSASVFFVWVRKSTVSRPVITHPSTATYASSEAILNVTGSCETGSTIELTGDATGSVVCVAASFSIMLPKFIDGDFNINVDQTDQAGNKATSSFVWNRHQLVVAPANVTLEVNKKQLFTFSGGSGVYTFTVVTNNSSGTINTQENSYTTGINSGVSDTLRVTDSLGASADIHVVTIAATADHLEVVNTLADEQSAIIGQLYSEVISVKVVDEYGNGIPQFPVLFLRTVGDITFDDSIVQLSNASGIVNMHVRAGTHDYMNVVQVLPLGTNLPDRQATGQSQLTFKFYSQVNNRGFIGANYSVTNNPTMMTVGDFDGDQVSDVVVLNSGDPSIGFLGGQIDGSFKTMIRKSAICNGANGIAQGDFNGDSKLDIVISCGASTAAAQLYIGNGDGTFLSAINLLLDNNAETIPSSILVDDFNKDGKLDIALTLAGNNVISIRFGQTNNQFSAPVTYNVGGAPVSLLAGDLNLDNNVDLVAINSQDNTISVLINSGNGVFSLLNTINVGQSPVAGQVIDINKDNYKDILIVNSSDGTVTVLLNNLGSSFNENGVLAVGGIPNSLVATDLDGDSKIDFAVVNSLDNNMNIAWGNGEGDFVIASAITVADTPNFVVAGDFNHDQIKDLLVIGNANKVIQFVPGTGNRNFNFIFVTDLNPSSMAFGDFNHDQKSDVAVMNTGSSTISVFNGLNNGILNSVATLDANDNSTKIISADLRKLSRSDLIINKPTKSKIRIFLNNADGTFADPVDVNVGNSPKDLAVGDFNRDGKIDLAVVNSASSTVSILFGAGDGTFPTKSDFSTGDAPNAIIVSDVNKDGILDLVVSSEGSNSISILIGNDNGTFRQSVNYSVASGPMSLVVADFNHDGKLDIAAACAVDTLVSVLIGNGDGSFRPTVNYSSGNNPTAMTTADLNGDGRQDLVIANGGNRTLTFLYSSNSGQFNSSSTIDTSGNVLFVHSNDVNSDGNIDLLYLDSTNSKIQILVGH